MIEKQRTFPDKTKDFLSRVFSVSWRLILQNLLAWFLFIPLSPFFFFSPEEFGQNEILLAMHELVKLFMITVSVAMIAKVVDEIELREFGLTRNINALVDFFAGLVITFIVLVIGFLFLMGNGNIQIENFAWNVIPLKSVFLYTIGTLLIFSFVGWSEELLSRGFQLQIIENKFGRFLAVFISSLLFSYAHRNNPNIDTSSLVFIFFGGLVFAYAYLKTRQLWLSIGLHTGWDFFVVVVFYGVPVNDLQIFHLINYSVRDNGSLSFIIYGLQYLELLLIVYLVNKYTLLRSKWFNIS